MTREERICALLQKSDIYFRNGFRKPSKRGRILTRQNFPLKILRINQKTRIPIVVIFVRGNNADC